VSLLPLRRRQPKRPPEPVGSAAAAEAGVRTGAVPGSPAALALGSAELHRRAREAVAALSECRLCPRRCGVDRLHGQWAVCKTGRHAQVSSAFPHMGEEDCLRGWHGSGTIFFTHCSLRCVFCQNFAVSQGVRPGDSETATPPSALAAIMLDLQARGCHNINLVTPEHVVPQMLEALAIAVAEGLHIPIVYNTSAYDSLESLAWLDGIIDVYMPDFKLWSRDASRLYLRAVNYPDAARAAIREMHRQVGSLVFDEDGLAVRGLLVRHLVMPGLLDETVAILEWIAAELGRDTYLSLLDQYYPSGRVSGRFPRIDRSLDRSEFAEALHAARSLGLVRIDERKSNPFLRPHGH
jgi:putative pyruvate formate lyase activating enzyme